MASALRSSTLTTVYRNIAHRIPATRVAATRHLTTVSVVVARTSSLLTVRPSPVIVTKTSPPFLTHSITTMSEAATAPKLDCLRELKVDHDNIRDLYERLKKAHQDKDEKLLGAVASTIVREASVHAEAEEVTIYPCMDQHGLREVAQDDREKHHSAKEAAAHLDQLIGALGKSADALDEVCKAGCKTCELIMKHAEEEEKNQIPKLIEKIGQDGNDKLARDFIKARGQVPSRPHPSAPQSGGAAQKTAGMAAKAADAPITMSRQMVDLKFEHASIAAH